jgi:hypothetical protein
VHGPVGGAKGVQLDTSRDVHVNEFAAGAAGEAPPPQSAQPAPSYSLGRLARIMVEGPLPGSEAVNFKRTRRGRRGGRATAD